MSVQSNFSGLRSLMSRMGFGSSTSLQSGVVNDPADPANPDDDDEADPADPADPADAAAPADPADPADPANPDDDDDDATAAPSDPSNPGANINTTSADYLAGMAAAEGRWATVLVEPAAQLNLELATDLLAKRSADGTPSLEASDIVDTCKRHGRSAETAPTGGNDINSSAQQLLDATPRKDLGSSEQQISASEAAQNTRKKAASAVNARLGGRGVKAQRAARERQSNKGD